MTTEAKLGYNTRFALASANSPSAYEQLSDVTNITPPGLSRDAIDATHMQSTEAWREFIAGLKDGGECALELNFDPGNRTAAEIIATFSSDDLLPCKVTFPDNSVWAFSAVCTGFEPEAPVDDKMVATATFKISGKPTFTPA